MQETTISPFIQELALHIEENDFNRFKERYLGPTPPHQFTQEELNKFRYPDGDPFLHKAVQRNGLAFIKWLLDNGANVNATARKDKHHGHYGYRASFAKTDKKEFVTAIESAYQKSFHAAGALLKKYGAIYQWPEPHFRIVKEIKEEIVEDLFDAIKKSNESAKQALLEKAKKENRLDDALIVIDVLAKETHQNVFPPALNLDSNNATNESKEFMRLVKKAEQDKSHWIANKQSVSQILDKDLKATLKNSIFQQQNGEPLHNLKSQEIKHAIWVADYYFTKSEQIANSFENRELIEDLTIQALIYSLLPSNYINVNYEAEEAYKMANRCLLKLLAKPSKNKEVFLKDLFEIFVKSEHLFEKFLTHFFELQKQFDLTHFVLAKIFYRMGQFDLAEACFTGNTEAHPRFKHDLRLCSDEQKLSEPLSTYYYADIQFNKWQDDPTQTTALEIAYACYLQVLLTAPLTNVLAGFSFNRLNKQLENSDQHAAAMARKYLRTYYIITNPTKIDYIFGWPTELEEILIMAKPRLNAAQHRNLAELIFKATNNKKINPGDKEKLWSMGLSELQIAIEQGDHEAIMLTAAPQFGAQLPIHLGAILVDNLSNKLITLDKNQDPDAYFKIFTLLKSALIKFAGYHPQNEAEDAEMSTHITRWAQSFNAEIFSILLIPLANKCVMNAKLFAENADTLKELFNYLHDKETLEVVEKLAQAFPLFAEAFSDFILKTKDPSLLPLLENSKILQLAIDDITWTIFLLTPEILPFVSDATFKGSLSKISAILETLSDFPQGLKNISLDIFKKLLTYLDDPAITKLVIKLLKTGGTAFFNAAVTKFKLILHKNGVSKTSELLLQILLNHLNHPKVYSSIINALKNHPGLLSTVQAFYATQTFDHPDEAAQLLLNTSSLYAHIDTQLFNHLTSKQSALQPFMTPCRTNFTASYIWHRYEALSQSSAPEALQEKTSLLFDLYRLIIENPSTFNTLDSIADQFLDPLANFFCACIRNKSLNSDFKKMKTNFERSFQQAFPLPKMNISWQQLPLRTSDHFNMQWENISGQDLLECAKSFIEKDKNLEGFPHFISGINASLSTYEDEIFLNIIAWLIEANKSMATSLAKNKPLTQDLWQIILMLNQPPSQFKETCQLADSSDATAIEKLETEFVKHPKFEYPARIQLIQCYVQIEKRSTLNQEGYLKALAHINALATYHEQHKKGIAETAEYLNTLINENLQAFQRVPLKVLAKLCLPDDTLILDYTSPIIRVYGLDTENRPDPQAKSIVTQYENVMIRLLKESEAFKRKMTNEQLATLLAQENIFKQVANLEFFMQFIYKFANYFKAPYLQQVKHPLFSALIKSALDYANAYEANNMLPVLQTFADMGDTVCCFLYACYLAIESPSFTNEYFDKAFAKGFTISKLVAENTALAKIWDEKHSAPIRERVTALFNTRKKHLFSSLDPVSDKTLAQLKKFEPNDQMRIACALVSAYIEQSTLTHPDTQLVDILCFTIHKLVKIPLALDSTNKPAKSIPDNSNNSSSQSIVPSTQKQQTPTIENDNNQNALSSFGHSLKTLGNRLLNPVPSEQSVNNSNSTLSTDPTSEKKLDIVGGIQIIFFNGKQPTTPQEGSLENQFDNL